jgi:hypothetical protein
MRFIKVCAVIGVLAACGGSITSVDGSKNTATLSPTDQTQLCNDLYNYEKSNFSTTDELELVCGSEAANEANCQQAYQTCMSQTTLGDAGFGATPNCTTFDQQIAQCNTTVSEYTKCFQEELTVIKNIDSMMPLCGQNAFEIAYLNAIANMSSDCISLMQTCFGSTSSGGDAGSD